MKKLIIVISVIVVLCLMGLGLYYFLGRNSISISGNNIPDNYICVFHGGVGEVTYSTYIYKIDNGQANRGFSYINTTNTTKSYGSSEWNIKVTSRGKVEWTDNVFGVAKKNNAYSYVTVPNSDKTYTIEEYMSMFIMN